MQQMHGIIPQLFDCWADPVAHLLLLKSSMDSTIKEYAMGAWTLLHSIWALGCEIMSLSVTTILNLT